MSENWNDTGVPLAYFITFRCYGTWLHGDERGSVDRDHNAYGTPTYPQRDLRTSYVQGLLKQPPVLLDARRRHSVEAAIRETCGIRTWSLFALNVRTNHVHSVVNSPGEKPRAVMTAFKANATRQMREDGCWSNGRRKGVRVTYGRMKAYPGQLITSCIPRDTICRIFRNPVATASRF